MAAKTVAEQLKEPAVVWICYPKANRSDINRDTVWPFRPLKPGEAPFAGGNRPERTAP